ncbi:hypothetical protein [Streptomyces sp. NPDC007100]|uniref:hypothetical protein n=1 Tax=unclassified Streptomyces TaxID=2593676 RepID=UPI0033EB8E62
MLSAEENARSFEAMELAKARERVSLTVHDPYVIEEVAKCVHCRCLVLWVDETGICVFCKQPLRHKESEGGSEV